MRNVIFIVPFIFCSQYVQAQSDFDMQINPKKLSEYLKKHKPLQQKITPLTALQLPADTARYSHTTVLGTIYALPQDRMPCLVPDKKVYGYNEPNLLLQQLQPFMLNNGTNSVNHAPGNTMPNAYQGKPLVWEKKP